MLHLKLLTLFAIFGANFCSLAHANPVPKSPCPKVFQYKVNDDNVLYGMVSIQWDATEDQTLQLYVELSIVKKETEYDGTIKLLTPKSEIFDRIIERKQIEYVIIFPVWNEIPPTIVKIAVNGGLVCSGLKKIGYTTVRHNTTTIRKPLNYAMRNTRKFFSLPANFDIKFQPKSHPHLTKIQSGKQIFKDNNFTIVFPEEVENLNENTDDSPSPWSLLDSCGEFATTESITDGGSIKRLDIFPWLVAIFKASHTGIDFMCSGSLISRKHVLTTAHCLGTNKSVETSGDLAVLGRSNLRQWSSKDGSKMVGIAEVSVHPEYLFENEDADVAVVVLEEEIEFTKFIQPICIRNKDGEVKNIIGQNGILVEWEKLSLSKPRSHALSTVSKAKCFPRFDIGDENFLCAEYKTRMRFCRMNKGSGLFSRIGNKWTLIGLESLSSPIIGGTHPCNLSGYVAFTNISKFAHWIGQFLK